jgi:hypothetical protein
MLLITVSGGLSGLSFEYLTASIPSSDDRSELPKLSVPTSLPKPPGIKGSIRIRKYKKTKSMAIDGCGRQFLAIQKHAKGSEWAIKEAAYPKC